jgi:hypothetical protein
MLWNGKAYLTAGFQQDDMAAAMPIHPPSSATESPDRLLT